MKIMVILLALSGLISLHSCKEKKEKLPVLTEQKVEIAEVSQPEPPRQTPQPIVKRANYYVVAGCFKMAENAERLNTKLLNEGHDSKIIPFYNMSMVTFGGYETRQEAQKALNQIVKEAGKEAAWVYPVK